MIKFGNPEAAKKLAEAQKTGDENKIREAWEAFCGSIVEQVRADFQDTVAANDTTILAQRGYRQLTSRETKFYEKLIEALRSNNPQQAFTTILGTDDEDSIMPSTIIEDVFKDLEQDYPILNAVDFQYVRYLTRYILNDHARQKAVWGKITDTITKEITSSFKVIDVTQNKLTAFAFVERGMLDLGPTFLDAYIRACLREALLYGLEDGIINGNGKDQPIGMIKDIHDGVSFDTGTGYPDKTAVEITEFTPTSYGAILAKMAETEDGVKRRGFTRVYMAANNKTYLTKILPATKVMGASGQYVSFIDSIFPTQYVECNSVADDKAVLFVPGEYHLYMGGNRDGVIEYSDDFKFLEDMRYFKIRLYGNGRATDDTCCVVLDVSKLTPAVVPVQVAGTVATSAVEA